MNRAACTTILLLAVAALAPVNPLHAQTSADSLRVAETVDGFHRALVAGDTAAILAALTSGARVLEGGAIETVAEYADHHLPADIAFAQAVQRERSGVEVTVRGDVAWAVSSSRAVGRWGEREIDSRSAELMVLERTPSGWRIAAIHWSSR